MLAGIMVLVYPGISLLVFAVVLGVWLIVFGALQITAAFPDPLPGRPRLGTGLPRRIMACRPRLCGGPPG